MIIYENAVFLSKFFKMSFPIFYFEKFESLHKIGLLVTMVSDEVGVIRFHIDGLCK